MSEQEQIQEETPASDEIKDETPEEQIVTEELAEKLGVSKTLVGKPIDELGKSLRELQTDYAKTKSKLKEVERAKPKEAEKPNLKAPDPLNFEKEDDYNNALRDFVIKVAQEVNAPLLQTVQANQQKVVMDTIQSQLPTGMDANEIANEWMEITQLSESDISTLTPQLLVNSIVNFAEAKQLKEVKQSIDKKTGDIVADKIRQSLRIQPQEHDLNSVDKTKAAPQGVVQRLIARRQAELQRKK